MRCALGGHWGGERLNFLEFANPYEGASPKPREQHHPGWILLCRAASAQDKTHVDPRAKGWPQRVRSWGAALLGPIHIFHRFRTSRVSPWLGRVLGRGSRFRSLHLRNMRGREFFPGGQGRGGRWEFSSQEEILWISGFYSYSSTRDLRMHSAWS